MKEYNGAVRNRYFFGKLLDASDLEMEQTYFLEKRRLHNRHLHGWGVVTGYAVSMRKGTVIVEPGMAIDCAGYDIVLDTRAELDVPNGASELYIVVEYCETAINPVPVTLGAEYSEQENHECSWIQEGCRIGFMDVDPGSDHDGMGPGTSGCGRRHPISIARLLKGKSDWELISCGRRSQPNHSL